MFVTDRHTKSCTDLDRQTDRQTDRGAMWFIGRVLDSRLRGVESLSLTEGSVVSMSKTILVQSRKTRPDMAENY